MSSIELKKIVVAHIIAALHLRGVKVQEPQVIYSNVVLFKITWNKTLFIIVPFYQDDEWNIKMLSAVGYPKHSEFMRIDLNNPNFDEQVADWIFETAAKIYGKLSPLSQYLLTLPQT